MITCVAIDDEPLALGLVLDHIAATPKLQLVASFTDAIAGLDHVRQRPPDLLLLDVQMPDITGLQLIRALPKPPLVILTTAYSEHAVEGFDLEVVDYLLKPFGLARFQKAVDRAVQRLTSVGAPSATPAHIIVRSGHDSVRMVIDDITHVEGMDDYVKFHRPGVRPVVSNMTMKAALDLLPRHRFLRVHRSFIVDQEKVTQISSNTVTLGDLSLPIGETYSIVVKARLRE
ncbi:MAG: DNA-binding response regulator [Flavobacteriales bacterium]|nr:DNA-binding response regulator [Flavobacteriales bacterium]MBK9288080.1 DNA-binding response regulator [Flavobacteriales bacterium]